MKVNRPIKPKEKIQPDQLRDGLRFWATGVAVVGAKAEGVIHGMTINSFTSLSLDPPLLLISLEKGTRTHDMVARSAAYGVSILSEEQRSISDRFAGRETEESERFAGLEVTGLMTESPLVEGALAHFDCRVVSTHDAGTHTLYIGEILDMQVQPGAEDSKPLLYYNRNYRNLTNF